MTQQPQLDEITDEPADEEQPQGEEPQGAGHRPAVVEAVRPKESEDPQEVADQGAVGIRALHVIS